ncbi:unnamed protein product [Rotaria sordida]|uniref:Uncharacterized protein n=1 Tax=Rotaria sordida TaxID=392033 RepID=A0A814KRY9_9BILA|nr:unnamed protein product [Rotaria sordida]
MDAANNGNITSETIPPPPYHKPPPSYGFSNPMIFHSPNQSGQVPISSPFYKAPTKLRDKDLNKFKQARQVYETTRYDPKTGQDKEESKVDDKTDCFFIDLSR